MPVCWYTLETVCLHICADDSHLCFLQLPVQLLHACAQSLKLWLTSRHLLLQALNTLLSTCQLRCNTSMQTRQLQHTVIPDHHDQLLQPATVVFTPCQRRWSCCQQLPHMLMATERSAAAHLCRLLPRFLLRCCLLPLQRGFTLCCLRELRLQVIKLALQTPSGTQLPLQPSDICPSNIQVLLDLRLRCAGITLLLPEVAQLTLQACCMPVLGPQLALEVRGLLLC